MIRTLLGLSVAATLSFAAGFFANASPSANGVLEGQIDILQTGGANLADDVSSPKKKAPCAACALVVLSKDGKTDVAQVPVDGEGRFRVALPPGDYLLDQKQPTRFRFTARPFTMVAGKTVHLDLEVVSRIEPM